MRDIEYEVFEDLEKFAASVYESTKEGQRYLNFFVSAELPIEAIQDKPIRDVTKKAEKWRAKEKPYDLFINHGEFIGTGLDHIVTELKNKPTSNRALYSLISEQHIIGHGDDPIPSFMIFQCALESDVLYCTVYFRALEVANFFRINLEEIRLNICDISQSIDFSKVRLSILAFSAYMKPDQIPLEKCQLDLMSAIQLCDMYVDDPKKIPELLDIKANETTVVVTDGLVQIKEWLSLGREHRWSQNLKSYNVHKIHIALDEAIQMADKLRDLRKRNSQHNKVDKVAEKYVAAIKKIAQEFRACLQQ